MAHRERLGYATDDCVRHRDARGDDVSRDGLREPGPFERCDFGVDARAGRNNGQRDAYRFWHVGVRRRDANSFNDRGARRSVRRFDDHDFYEYDEFLHDDEYQHEYEQQQQYDDVATWWQHDEYERGRVGKHVEHDRCRNNVHIRRDSGRDGIDFHHASDGDRHRDGCSTNINGAAIHRREHRRAHLVGCRSRRVGCGGRVLATPIPFR